VNRGFPWWKRRSRRTKSISSVSESLRNLTTQSHHEPPHENKSDFIKEEMKERDRRKTGADLFLLIGEVFPELTALLGEILIIANRIANVR